MKKILLIQFQANAGVPYGGSMANERCVSMARRLYGEENVEVKYLFTKPEKNPFRRITELFWLHFGYYRGLTPQRVNEIVRIAQDYDTILLCSSLFGIIARRLKQAGYRGRIVVHFHNVESVYYESRLPKTMPFRHLLIQCASQNDYFSLEYADKTMALSQRDSNLLEKLHGKPTDYVIPMSLSDKCKNTPRDFAELTSARPICYFIGSNFPANSEGLIWFVQHVLPKVDIQFAVIGKDMSLLQAQTPCLKTINVYGDVADLSPYYEEADFLIMPIFSGSGIKVKTCEALMYGKNIIGTTEAFEGYNLNYNKIGSLCNTEQEFIDAIQTYAAHPIPKFNSYARTIYEKLYSDDYAVDKFNEFLK